MLLDLKSIHVHYGKLEAVKGVSMLIPENNIVSLLGANGSGKSTILKAISGINKLTSGAIWFDGQRIDEMPTDRIVKLGIGQVPEGRRVFPYMSVVENLKMGAITRKDKAGIISDIEEIYKHFPVLERSANKRARDLSGGEQQMLAIARALMARPRMLLMDEPLQGLAPMVMGEIQDIIVDLNQKIGITVLMVEHNVHMALGMAHKVYILETGQVIHEGAPNELSETEYVQKVYLAG
jgi:branched-chain amino acid transport system ATP-binding protein